MIDGGRSFAEVARNVGCHEMTLGKWVRRAREVRDPAQPPDAELSVTERVELIQLRADLKDSQAESAELTMQVEFAKRVATWFAKGE